MTFKINLSNSTFKEYSNTKKKSGGGAEFPRGPVVRTWRFHCWGLGSVPGQGTKIPQAAQRGQKKKKNSNEYEILLIYLHTPESYLILSLDICIL